MRKSLLSAFALLLLSISVFAASSMEIYIHNKPVQGAVITQGDEVYVTAAEMKKLIRGSIEWDEKAGTVTLDGRESTIKMLKSNNTVFLPLKAVSKALGYNFSYNKKTGIMDVYRQTAYKPGTSAVAQPTGTATPGATPGDASAGTPGGTPGTAPSPAASGAPQTDPLTIVETSQTRDGGVASQTSAMRIFCNVTNGRSSEARNVVATCVLKTLDGKEFTKSVVNVGNIPAGEKKEAIFYITNDGGGIPLNRSYSVTSDK
ncbi:MAG: hypothetical protein AB2L14_11520 [Candidatus Xenobiia bacterium LiM19]